MRANGGSPDTLQTRKSKGGGEAYERPSNFLQTMREHKMLLTICLPFKIQYFSCKIVSVMFKPPCLACWCMFIRSNLINECLAGKSMGFFASNDIAS